MSMTPTALAGGQQLVAVPSNTAPAIVTSSNQDSQAILIQAMLASVKDPAQQASLQAALAVQARQAANKYYLEATQRKVAPALTNGTVNQAYALGTPLTFTLNTALNGFCEGFIIRYTVNYTLAAGTAAVYGLTAAGVLGLIDNIEVRYNKSQHKVSLQDFRELALMGALEDYVVPEAVFGGGQSVPSTQNYLNSGMSTTVGAQTAVVELFVPFNVMGQNDPRGLLPIIVGDTGIQIIVTTPQAILGGDAYANSLYPASGTGHAVTGVSGTVAISAVYRDGDCWMGSAKVPFDLSAVQGTFQMQADTPLMPLVANSYQRQKLTIMGQHVFVILYVIDGLQSQNYALNNNIVYIERAKDGVGGNVFDKYGLQTNISVNDFFYLNRLDAKQDIDQGVVPIIAGPTLRQGDPHLRGGRQYLDNSRTGWPDWRYCVTVAATGNGTTNGFPCTPRIIPKVFYVNPTGLIPV